MKYVYILQSTFDSEHYYTGITGDLKARIAKHNAGAVPHTSKFKPWKLKTYIAFNDESRHWSLRNILNPHRAEHLQKSGYELGL